MNIFKTSNWQLPVPNSSTSSTEGPSGILLTEEGTRDIQSELSQSSKQNSFCMIQSSTTLILSNDTGSAETCFCLSSTLQGIQLPTMNMVTG